MPENETPVESTPAESTPVETHETPAEESPRMGLRIDERTGRKVVETIPSGAETKEPEKAEPTEQPQAEEPPAEQPQVQQPQVQKTQFYSPAELSLAIQMGQVDESKIPPEYQPQYLAMKQQNAPKPPPQKSETELRNEFLDAVNKAAHDKAMKDVGITEDELSMGEFSDNDEIQTKVSRYKAALDVARSQIISGYSEQVRVEQMKAQQENEFKKGVADWISEQRTAEPNFDEIGFFMQEHYKTMPYEKAVAIAPAIQKAMQGKLDPQSAEVVKNYYEDCRKEFYAKKNGTSTTPSPRSPSVERKGTGQDVVKPIDYAEQLRAAPVRDKSKIVEAWLSSMKR
jgi:hypothetical protein